MLQRFGRRCSEALSSTESPAKERNKWLWLGWNDHPTLEHRLWWQRQCQWRKPNLSGKESRKRLHQEDWWNWVWMMQWRLFRGSCQDIHVRFTSTFLLTKLWNVRLSWDLHIEEHSCSLCHAFSQPSRSTQRVSQQLEKELALTNLECSKSSLRWDTGLVATTCLAICLCTASVAPISTSKH